MNHPDELTESHRQEGAENLNQQETMRVAPNSESESLQDKTELVRCLSLSIRGWNLLDTVQLEACVGVKAWTRARYRSSGSLKAPVRLQVCPAVRSKQPDTGFQIFLRLQERKDRNIHTHMSGRTLMFGTIEEDHRGAFRHWDFFALLQGQKSELLQDRG